MATDRITKQMVETEVIKLNTAASQLGMRRKFTVEFGSFSNGVSNYLVEEIPQLNHPTRTSIGYTYRTALTYVSAMRHALVSAVLDTPGRRVGHQPTPQDAVSRLAYDPDARSNRRPY